MTPPRDRAAIETVLPAMLAERQNRVGKHFEHERDDKIIAALEEAKSILSGDRVVVPGDIVIGACNLLDTIKSEWGDQWSEWDQSIRDGLSDALSKVQS